MAWTKETKGRDKFWVWQVAIYLLYSNQPYITRLGGRYLSIHLASMARDLKLDSKRVKKYIGDIYDMDLIAEVKFHTGTAVVKLRTPPNLVDDNLEI